MPQTSETIQRNKRQLYHINATVKGLDLAARLRNIEIVSSLTVPYRMFNLVFTVDSQDMVRHVLYGKDPITLEIKLTTETGAASLDTVSFVLLPISLSVPIKIKPETIGSTNFQHQHPTDDTVTLTAVAKHPYILMTTVMNKLYKNQTGKIPVEIVEDLANEFLKKTYGGLEINIDKEQKSVNKEKIEQIIVPPAYTDETGEKLTMTFRRSIDYIDRYFGLYNSPFFTFCKYKEFSGNSDKPPVELCMWNLKQKLERGDTDYTIYHLPAGSEHGDVYKNVGKRRDKFMYTRSELQTYYRGNQTLLKNAYEQRFLIKPIDKLFKEISLNADDIVSTNSPASNTRQIHFDPDLKKRIAVRGMNESGFNEDDTFARMYMAQRLSFLSEIEFGLERNIILNKVLDVGIPVTFEPKNAYIAAIYHGKYIVTYSNCSLSRVDSELWSNVTTLRLGRTNLEHTGQ